MEVRQGLSGMRAEYGYAELGEFLQTNGAADPSILSVPHPHNPELSTLSLKTSTLKPKP